MKRIFFCLPLLFFLLFFCNASFSQTRNNNSLLWRISGNGLTRPSYLFGTMHVYDKRAFNFKDSLYIFLEQAEGFALEFNPDSANKIIEAYLNGSIKREDEETSKLDISPSEVKLMQKKMVTKKVNYQEEDKKTMVDYFIARLLTSDKKQKNSMNTFMDAFLYEIAKQYEKKMYGLEEISVQTAALNSLSKGLKIKKFVNLLGKWEPENESPVAELYYREDLDSIDLFYTNYFTEETLDDFLYKRNKGMAGKMDSLMHLQSMFMAVGAAHLAGDKSVIALLRKKGYTIEPVLSSQRISASEYKMKKVEQPGYLVKNEQLGLEYEMPGKPITQDGEAGKTLAYYYDLGGGLVYMTICGKLTDKESKKNPEEIANHTIDPMISAMGGKILSSKMITGQGLKGLEIVCLAKDNSYCRLYELVSKNMFYIFSVSGQKKDNLYSDKAEKYLTSFKLTPIPATQWTPYEFPEDGFKILFPGKPKAEPLKTDPTSGPKKSYTYFDANSGVNYTVSAGKTKAYSEYLNNESFFKSYLENVRTAITNGEPIIADTIINGFPGKKFTRPSEDNTWKGFAIKREHTSYFVVAEFEHGVGDKEAEKFLNSFLFINYQKPSWQMQDSPNSGFSAWAPSTLYQKEYDSTEVYSNSDSKKSKEYYAYDPYSAITYFINANSISDYYWAPNEDSIYDHWKSSMLGWNDSLISYTTVKNGGIIGRELIYFNKTDSTTKRQRLLLNGRTMYSFHVNEPVAFADEDNINLFFNNFRITGEQKTNEILSTSPDKLFSDLASNDSTTFQNAYDALNEVKFYESQLMLLMEKSLAEYPKYENNYQTVNDRLLSFASDLFQNAEPSTKKEVVSFIENNYAKPGKVIEAIRFPFLEIIAKEKTVEAYQLVKKLLSQKLPSKENQYLFFNHCNDSLSLTKTLYPDLLQYINDTTMGLPIAALTKKMLDSNIISIDIVLAIKNDILKLARRQLRYTLKESEDDYPDYRLSEFVSLMGMMKQKETDDLLVEFLKTKTISLKKEAALALIKNNKPVSTLALNKIATDKYERANFYDELEKINKVNLFPADFRSQQKLAESYIYQYLIDDNDGEQTDAELIYIKKVDENYKGEKKRFYFFRVNFPQPEDSGNESGETTSESYLAIAGPFDIDTKKMNIELSKNITGLYYDEKFDGMMMDDYFKKFIEERLKWQ